MIFLHLLLFASALWMGAGVGILLGIGLIYIMPPSPINQQLPKEFEGW